MDSSAQHHSAVSHVVGVILMVAVTVILSATIGVFVFNLGSSTTDKSTGSAATTITEHDNGQVTVELISQTDGVDKLLVKTGNVTENLTTVGETVTVPAFNRTVTVIAIQDGARKVLRSYTPKNSGATNLVAHYTVSAGSGDTLYDATESRNGIIHNATWTNDSITSGTAITFNGSYSYTHINRKLPDDQTVTAWIKTTDAGSTYTHYDSKAIVHQEAAGVAHDWGFGIDKDGQLVYGNGDNSTDYAVRSSQAVNDGTWHFVAFTRNQTTGEMRLYIDGDFVATATGSTTRLLDADRSHGGMEIARAGDENQNDTYFDEPGTFDEIRLYTENLSEGDLDAIYTETQP